MNVTSAIFEVVEPGSAPGFQLRIHANGFGFISRAAPVRARVGAVRIEGIFLAPGGGGFTGYLARAPNAGDRLFVGYLDEPEFMTDVVYGMAPNV